MEDRHRVDAPPDRTLEDLLSFFGQAFPGNSFQVDDDYFERGEAASLFALELVTFVEQHFHVTVETEDLDLDNFRTIGRTAAFVRAKQAEVSAAAPRRTGGRGHG